LNHQVFTKETLPILRSLTGLSPSQNQKNPRRGGASDPEAKDFLGVLGALVVNLNAGRFECFLCGTIHPHDPVRYVVLEVAQQPESEIGDVDG